MNQVIDIIRHRRSVRSYSSKEISKVELQEIICAGNLAPSGCNAQEWRFVVVVEDASFKQKLLSAALSRYKTWIQNAPQQLKDVRKDMDSNLRDSIYYSAPAVVFVIGWGMTADMDCPMVCENMMLAARSLGIGSCWVYFGQLGIDDPEVRKTLELKDTEKVYGPIIFGYPKTDFPQMPSKKPPVIKWI